jgi:hypothetical protein
MKKLLFILILTIILLASMVSASPYSDLNKEQKTFYWKCIKPCYGFLQTQEYQEYMSCAISCMQQAQDYIPQPDSCEDTDNGIDYKNFGIVTDNKYSEGKEDYCYTANGKNYVFEGVCVNNKYRRYQKNCKEFGQTWDCVEGACVNQVCDEVDNGVVSNYPDCEISCNEGYYLEDDECVLNNQPPVIEYIKSKKIAVNGELSFEIPVTDDNMDELEYSAEDLPEGSELISNMFNWIPEEEQVGVYEVTFIVTDGEFTDEKTVEIEVFPNLDCGGIVQEDDYFGLDGTLLEYKKSDHIGKTSPQIEFKIIDTGETWSRSISWNDGEGSFDLKIDGITYDFVSASDTSEDDWDIMYIC